MNMDLSALARRLHELEQQHARTLQELRRLQDMEEIRQLKYRYWRAIDTRDSGLLRGTLTDDFNGRFVIGSFQSSAGNADEFVRKMALTVGSGRIGQHQGHHPEITIDGDGRRASGIWYLQSIAHNLDTRMLSASTCFYDDRYVRTDDGWKLQSSSFEAHVAVENEMNFMPNYTARYFSGGA